MGKACFAMVGGEQITEPTRGRFCIHPPQKTGGGGGEKKPLGAMKNSGACTVGKGLRGRAVGGGVPLFFWDWGELLVLGGGPLGRNGTNKRGNFAHSWFVLGEWGDQSRMGGQARGPRPTMKMKKKSRGNAGGWGGDTEASDGGSGAKISTHNYLLRERNPKIFRPGLFETDFFSRDFHFSSGFGEQRGRGPTLSKKTETASGSCQKTTGGAF